MILTKSSLANNKSRVLHAHAKQHKAQQLTKKLLLQEHIDSPDTSSTTHITGINIPLVENICDTTPMQIVNFVKEVEPWSDDE